MYTLNKVYNKRDIWICPVEVFNGKIYFWFALSIKGPPPFQVWELKERPLDQFSLTNYQLREDVEPPAGGTGRECPF